MNAWITRIAPIVRCATAQSALSLTRASLASALIRADSATIAKNRTGTIARATAVMRASIWSITTVMPPSSTTDVRIGKNPFIVSVWIASVSAVSRKSRSPTSRRLWNAIERRWRWA